MTITVVKGLVNQNRPTSLSTGNSASSQQSPQLAQAATHATSTDAVNITKAFRSIPQSEKIKDPKEAKAVAKDVAENLVEESDVEVVHGELHSSSARGHLVN